MNKILLSIVLLATSACIFYMGALYGQRSADLQKFSYEIQKKINDIKCNHEPCNRPRSSNHESIKEDLERYANYLAGEYPLYKSDFYDIDKIESSFESSLIYASNEISRPPRAEIIEYWENLIVTDPETESFSRSKVLTANNYYDLLEKYSTVKESP